MSGWSWSWLALSLLGAARTQERSASGAAVAVDAIATTVADLARAKQFFTGVLDFVAVDERGAAGDDAGRLWGVFGWRVQTARLRLGAEFLELTEVTTPRGRPYPADTKANDAWFQHIAIVVSDMDRAYERLRAHDVAHASSAPQTLPAWNENAGGIRAFYFRDRDGHFLELLQFPPGKGEARWQRQDALFLGIDHTALVVADTDTSLAFYRDTLGLRVAGTSENWGPEQERLNGVFGARLRITTLRASHGPGIELLEYLAPGPGRPAPLDLAASDLAHWHVAVRTDDVAATFARLRATRARFVSPGPVAVEGTLALTSRDPDGHVLLLVEAGASSR